MGIKTSFPGQHLLHSISKTPVTNIVSVSVCVLAVAREGERGTSLLESWDVWIACIYSQGSTVSYDVCSILFLNDLKKNLLLICNWYQFFLLFLESDQVHFLDSSLD